ncbi:DUF3289 family protein [Pantoea sp. Ap-870]|uniref:DUF3289 family protein n=1 Tax=Pantoea sp. Ap-870 TaxID=2608358 RepID=UPI0014198975|nr:DUF3289 family protein [Pantoea sp. Ap-870]NIE52427.1 DUF3289 family protein [Pantoea sp. Ap-870]
MEDITKSILLFSSQKKENDFRADDMLCGDLTTEICINKYGLNNVSAKLNPYTLEPTSVFNRKKLNKYEAAKILFSEFRELARFHSFYGPYKEIIFQIINHMELNSGRPYQSLLLNSAFKEMLLKQAPESSMLNRIKLALQDSLLNHSEFDPERLKADMMKMSKPKFSRKVDNFNGLGISIHDIHHVSITLENVCYSQYRYSAKIKVKGQDHFGLDDRDILHPFYNKLRIFNIWFILQRHKDYAYKPFFTNMEATIELS